MTRLFLAGPAGAPPVPAGPVAAVVLLGAALLIAGGPPGCRRLRALATAERADTAPVPPLRASWVAVGAVAAAALGWALAGVAAAVVTGGAAGLAGAVASRSASARAARDDTDAADLACGWELVAVCLEAGLPVAAAVCAAAERLAGATGAQLRRIAGELALGADPGAVWEPFENAPALMTFARAAGRSAGTGAALAQVGRAESARIRAELLDTAQARAQRAAVLITGPLGLCFLPAFLVLGIAPVVIGLAGEALAQW